MPTALVTGSPDRVPEITIALKSAGFDILAAGVESPDDAPDLQEGAVDCYVQLPVDRPRSPGGPLRATRDVIAHELVDRFDRAVQFLPLLAPDAVVVLVTGGAGFDHAPGRPPDPGGMAQRRLVELLAEVILRDQGRAGVRTRVVSEERASEDIAALAGAAQHPEPWWRYADLDPDLGFADWRASVLCLATRP